MSLDLIPSKHIPLYTSRMAGSVGDKLFFLEHLSEIDGLLDYGCADGAVLRAVQGLRPDLRLAGYDYSDRMIERAQRRSQGIRFESGWANAKQGLKGTRRSCLLASSVLHEVVSFGTEKSLEMFWRQVVKSPFKFLAIRDMSIGQSEAEIVDPDFADTIRGRADQTLLESFEEKWGSIDARRNAVHFLLKRRYRENWSTELRENYLAVTHEHILSGAISKTFSVVYREAYTPAFLQDELRREMQVEFPCPTHLKIILRRR